MQLNELIILCIVLVLNSLFIFGILKATSYTEDKEGNITDKMILWKLRYWSVKYLGNHISSPLFFCSSCMSSVWGFVFYFSFYTFSYQHLLIFIFYVISLCGFNSFMNRFYND